MTKINIKKFKEFVLCILSFMLIMTSIIPSMGKKIYAENDVHKFVVKTWLDVNDYLSLPLMCEYGTTIVKYEYDQNFCRISKEINGEKTVFKYEKCDGSSERTRLIYEYNDNYFIEYLYDDSSDKASGFVLDGNLYKYVYDNNNLIHEIVNTDGKVEAIYEYNEDYNVSIKGNKNIGKINSLVMESYYWDKESGYYYHCGVYNDLKNHSILKKPQNNNEVAKLSISTRSTDYVGRYNMDVSHTNGWYLYESGASIPYSKDGKWTSGLSDVELLARTIYGEFTYSKELSSYTGNYYDQRRAVAWVIQNRIGSSKFPNTMRATVTQKDAFGVITGDEDETSGARNPIKRSSAWQDAILLASYIYCANTGNYGPYSASSIMYKGLGKPTGISNQLYFVKIATWNKNYNPSTKKFTYNGVTYATVGNIATNVGNIQTGQTRNVFFNFK